MKFKQRLIALLLSAGAGKAVFELLGIGEWTVSKVAYGGWTAGQATLYSGFSLLVLVLVFDVLALWLIRSPALERLRTGARRDVRLLAAIWVLWPLAYYTVTLFRGQDWGDVLSNNMPVLFVPQLFATACLIAYRWIGRAPA
jgi:hypothetical protein